MSTRSYSIPIRLTHAGLALPRPHFLSAHGQGVIGDPCFVHDQAIGGLRMFLFMDPPAMPRPSAARPPRWDPASGSSSGP